MDKSIKAYKDVVQQEAIDHLFQLAKRLKGQRITHISSTLLGGGVAEILSSMVPLCKSLGIDTDWQIIEAPLEFFEVTKRFHNNLQGKKQDITAAQLKLYEEINETNAKKLKHHIDESSIIFVHDPQPAALIKHFPKRKNHWIWRCHVDASKPEPFVWNYLSSFLTNYDATIYSLIEFAHHLPHPIYIVPPSIDPLSDKNRALKEHEIRAVFKLYKIDPTRPFLLQVSRFDRFKDHLGVIDAYRLVKKMRPEVQLVFPGTQASDDPEGQDVLAEVQMAAAGDPDIHILLLDPHDRLHVNALQRASSIILQKSIKEGFGLTVTEGLWKAKPVIGGNTGGIRLQIVNDHTGYIVNTPEGAAYRIRYLMQNAEKAKIMGENGQQYVREKFLITRHLRDYLGVAISLLTSDTDRVEL